MTELSFGNYNPDDILAALRDTPDRPYQTQSTAFVSDLPWPDLPVYVPPTLSTDKTPPEEEKAPASPTESTAEAGSTPDNRPPEEAAPINPGQEEQPPEEPLPRTGGRHARTNSRRIRSRNHSRSRSRDKNDGRGEKHSDDDTADENTGSDENAGNSGPAIIDLDEDGRELESGYIRRVARRQALRSDRGAPGDYVASEDAIRHLRAQRKSMPAWEERLLRPLVHYLARRQERRRIREREAAAWPSPQDIRSTPELSAEEAAEYYNGQFGPLRLRMKLMLALFFVMLWLGFSLPMPGMLGQNLRLQAAVSMVFLLTCMLCALDVITVGLRQLFSLHPAMEALCAAACLFSLFDACLCACGVTDSLPFCASAAFSLLAGLCGEASRCKADSLNLLGAIPTDKSSMLYSVKDGDELNALIRAKTPEAGIVRRSEEPDGCQNCYTVAAPLLLIVSLLLTLLSAISQDWKNTLHNFCAYLAVCANTAGFLSYALPWLVASLRLKKLEASIAGWSGCSDIGRSPRVIITDKDLFPDKALEIQMAYHGSSSSREKAVSYTFSILQHAGSNIDAIFQKSPYYDLYTPCTVEDFKCHDGGGFSAYIHGEPVLVGSYGFMTLNSVRGLEEIEPHLKEYNSIYVAIRNRLAGIFVMNYRATVGTKTALDLLLKGKTLPVFAIRDFNITPRLLQTLFRLGSLSFEFPSFRERFRLADLAPEKHSLPAAVLSRSGAHCSVETADIGRKMYTACITNTIFSVFSSALGLLIVFLCILGGNGQNITTGRLIFYSFLFSLPCIWTSLKMAE